MRRVPDAASQVIQSGTAQESFQPRQPVLCQHPNLGVVPEDLAQHTDPLPLVHRVQRLRSLERDGLQRTNQAFTFGLGSSQPRPVAAACRFEHARAGLTNRFVTDNQFIAHRITHNQYRCWRRVSNMY